MHKHFLSYHILNTFMYLHINYKIHFDGLTNSQTKYCTVPKFQSRKTKDSAAE